MPRASATKRATVPASPASAQAVRIAVLASVDPDGTVRVELSGEAGARVAWLGLAEPPSVLLDAVANRARCLVVFSPDAPDTPVVVGLLRERLDVEAFELAQQKAAERLVSLRAKESLELVCGDARIELRADGRVFASGNEVRTLSTGATRIEGATVKIN